MSDCRVCYRPTPDSAVLCSGCGNKLSVALGEVAALDEQLLITVAKNAKFGNVSGGAGKPSEPDDPDATPGAARRPLPINYDASIMRSSLHNTLSTWVRVLAEEG
jgi:hypothetical protein